MATRIVGICLVRNEENFALWALGNALDFCDEILVIDNFSSDRTYPLLERFAAANPKVRLIRDANASGTNAYIQEYIGQDVWLFGIDGDEIYDREGLARFRARLLAGEFAAHWQVVPHTANATVVDLDAEKAIAYLRAVSPGKLYIFAGLESWRPDRQRLHGPFELKSGQSATPVRLNHTESWDGCDFRCLHLCFFPRSSSDGALAVRSNITDQYWRHAWRRPVFTLLLRLGLLTDGLRQYLLPRAMPIKNRHYMRGPVETVRLGGFGRPKDYSRFDPDADRAEAVVAETSRSRADQPDLRSEFELSYGRADPSA